MKRYARLTPEGTRDVLFGQAYTEFELSARLRAFFDAYGYLEVRTPGIEYYDVFGATDQYFPQASMYKTTNREGRLVVMRPDATMPIARLVATKLKGRAMPQRLFYDQMIYRASEGLDGLSHEMHQVGVELIGSASAKSDREMLFLASEVFRRLGFADYRLELGHVGMVEALLEVLDIDEALAERLREALEAKNFSRLRDVLEPMADAPAAALFMALPGLFGGAETFAKARALFAPVAPACLPMIEALEVRYKEACKTCPEEHLMVDFSLANQADYYTGLVFRGYVGGAGAEVLAGGRYDGLVGEYGLEAPAIGFGVRVDLLARVLMREEGAPARPFSLLYAEEREWFHALAWRSQAKERILLALADSQAEALAEAEALGAEALFIYGEGMIRREEVRRA